MGLFKKRKTTQSAPQEEQQQGQERRGAAAGDARLPGLAGYPTGPLPKKKNHMPPQRFTFKSPGDSG